MIVKKFLLLAVVALLGVGYFFGQFLTKEKVIYKCPSGQVEVIEDEGLETEVKRCYTPGISYVDHRPMSVKRIKHL